VIGWTGGLKLRAMTEQRFSPADDVDIERQLTQVALSAKSRPNQPIARDWFVRLVGGDEHRARVLVSACERGGLGRVAGGEFIVASNPPNAPTAWAAITSSWPRGAAAAR
jgi:hypothetical protein